MKHVLACCFVSVNPLAAQLTGLLRGAKLEEDSILKIGRDAQLVAAAAVTNTLAKYGSDKCTTCGSKDYSDQCPLGWTELAEDGMCSPPTEYAGFCASQQSFSGMSWAEKKEVESTCDSCWPCSGTKDAELSVEPGDGRCVRDWHAHCPNGFTPTGRANAGVRCSADIDYEGGCEREAVFQSLGDKRAFADRCATSWPCRQNCGWRGLALCPASWLHSGSGICQPPDNYDMAQCPGLRSFMGWTDEMKNAAAERCHLRWQCASDEDMSFQEKMGCSSLDMSGCPTLWTLGGNVCRPPVGVVGDCARSFNLTELTGPAKIQWASKCGWTWPCSGDASGRQFPSEVAGIDTSSEGPVNISDDIIAL